MTGAWTPEKAAMEGRDGTKRTGKCLSSQIKMGIGQLRPRVNEVGKVAASQGINPAMAKGLVLWRAVTFS